MVERLLGRDIGELVGGQMTQRAARGGEEDAADFVTLLAPETLPDGGVLRVDRSELPAAAVDGVAGRVGRP